MGLLASIGKRLLTSSSSAHVTTGTGARSLRWRPASLGPNVALDYSAIGLRNQSRELIRKNTLASAGVERLVSNVAGHLLDGVSDKVLARAFEYWKNIDQEIGERIEQAVGATVGGRL